MIAAIVLAAGLSRRMGAFKLLLPWGGSSVLEQVVETIDAAGLSEIVVVTGHRADEVASALERPPQGARRNAAVRIVYNPRYLEGEMLSSIQAGLRALGEEVEAALLCLGDQPQMRVGTVQAVMEAMREGLRTPEGAWQIVIPSYDRRRGHPVVVARPLWPAILSAQATLREVLDARRDEIHYVVVDTPSILADLDTPEDYERARPAEAPPT